MKDHEERDPWWWLDWLLIGGMTACVGVLIMWAIRLGVIPLP
jgi:hypothetical protein